MCFGMSGDICTGTVKNRTVFATALYEDQLHSEFVWQWWEATTVYYDKRYS